MIKMPQTREEIVFMAKIAEQCEQYKDMLEYMHNIIALETELTFEERQLFYIAYKNVISPKMFHLRGVMTFEMREIDRNSKYLPLIQEFRSQIESELRVICHDGINSLNKLIKEGIIPEAKVFYYKMQSDLYRYLSTFERNEAKEIVVQKAYDLYQQATDLAKKEMKCEHPLRLRLALNYSVFYYEILKNINKALELSNTTVNEVSALLLEKKDEEQYKEANTLIQLIKDNISFWNQDLKHAHDLSQSDSNESLNSGELEESKCEIDEIVNEDKNEEDVKIELL